MDKNPIKTAVRKRRTQERFGDVDPRCVLCGRADLPFVGVTQEWLEEHGAHQHLTELHHVVGRQHDPNLVVPLCRNCHGDLTEGLLQAGVSMRPEPDARERVALMLEALAVFFEQLVKALRRWAESLRDGIIPEASNE